MSPQKIIWGKVSSVYLIVLFYSAAVPFLVFSYLLHGIDLPTILWPLPYIHLKRAAHNGGNCNRPGTASYSDEDSRRTICGR